MLVWLLWLGGEVCLALPLCLLVLLTLGLNQLAVGEEHPVGQLGLVLEPDSVPCLMVLHSMLQDHEWKHPLGFGVREFALGDECDAGILGMDNLIGELAHV